ncbi:MAG: DegT/DnrJ/EryC1/StrS family aminotransferase [Nitrospinota bacterium]|nr:DegT/DnrJ/EryC1/StrS family aminotransferase [Nitrospinota bacterium]
MSSGKINVPYVDVASLNSIVHDEIIQEISNVIQNGNFILGEEVSKFEEKFAEKCETKYAIGVNSGTDALILSLRALDIGEDDEVITVPNSFVATSSAIALLGAKPVFVDVGDDLNIDPFKVEEKISKKTKAILPVHLTGRPSKMAPLVEISDRYGLHIVEDSAQAFLAEYNGKKVGSFGITGCFSLHPLKTLSAIGDGGIITTDNEDLFDKMKVLRNLGLRTRDDCEFWSGNSRLDNLQAAILLVKMKYIEEWTEQRISNAIFYENGLSHFDNLILPVPTEKEKSVFHTYIIQTEKRDELKSFLSSRGIQTAIHYPVPIHLQSIGLKLGYQKGSFPVAEEQAKKILSLPIYQGLNEEQLSHVIETIEDFFNS